MKELKTKLLHYCVDWSGEDSADHLETIMGLGFSGVWLETYHTRRNCLLPSIHSNLFFLAYAHFLETGGLIDYKTLLHRFEMGCSEPLAREMGEETAAVSAEAKATIKAAYGSKGNGTEIPYVVEQLNAGYIKDSLCTVITSAAADIERTPPQALAQNMIEEIQRSQSHASNGKAVKSVNNLVEVRREQYGEIAEGDSEEEGIYTGFLEMDKQTGGLRAGEVALFVGDTGLGKTQFREKILFNMWRAGHSVIEVLSECFAHDVVRRLECMALCSQVSWGEGDLATAVRNAKLNEANRKAYFSVLDSFQENDAQYLCIEPDAYESLTDLDGIIADLKRKHGVVAIGVDDLHNQYLRDARTERDDLRQGEVMAWLKDRVAIPFHLIVLGEVQEQQSTVGRKVVRASEVIKYSHKFSAKADMVVRLFGWSRYPPPYKLVQVLKHKTRPDSYEFPITMDHNRMFIDNAPEHIGARYNPEMFTDGDSGVDEDDTWEFGKTPDN